MKKISFAIHGGAGTILKSEMNPSLEKAYKAGLKAALKKGYELIKDGQPAIEAVEKAVKTLEDNPLFNAGKGAVFSADGTHEMDAAIMDGSNLNAGGVCGINNIKNPIELARLVMEKSEHVLLGGKGALEFAKQMNCPTEKAAYFYDEFRFNQWQRIKGTNEFQLDHSKKKTDKFGTVGAVALDMNGDLAAATSTGGMTNKKFGRIGDSPIIGAGLFVDGEIGAATATGVGEAVMRTVGSFLVVELMRSGMHPQKACETAVKRIMGKMETGNIQVGYLALDKRGRYGAHAIHPGFNYALATTDSKEGKVSEKLIDSTYG